jgi:adenylate kinase
LVQLSTGDMLRAAVKAGTAIGRKVADIMARGALVPDDIVVSIVAERIQKPDARKGFILDGFPRTVPQAEALDRMLARHGLALDAVIELRVDEDALIKRIESRIAQTKARGETLREDDNPDVLHRRLSAYREQTAPLVAYYRRHGTMRSLDGMAPIPQVATEIERVLENAEATAKPVKRAAAGPPGRGRRLTKRPAGKPPGRRRTAKKAGAAASGRPKAGNRRKGARRRTAARKALARGQGRDRRGR